MLEKLGFRTGLDYLSINDIPFNALDGTDKAERKKRLKAFVRFINQSGQHTDLKPVKVLPPVNKYVIRHGSPWPNNHLRDGNYLYVVMPDGEVRISRDPRECQIISHPALALGKPVVMAGEMHVEGKKITGINNKSGHYEPEPLSLFIAEAAFKFWGIWNPSSNLKIKHF